MFTLPTSSAEAPAFDGGARPAAVELRNVSVRYKTVTALADFSLRVEHGETVALLGPSGSGKSTALKAIAGFERPAHGRILLDGRDVTAEAPAQRGIGVVVQSYALFPHMRVDANVAYGLKARRMPKDQIAARVREMLAMVGMADHARKLPRELSGGQQQRIAVARALAIRPLVLLLDEPLSALDARMRQDMLAELAQLRAELPDIAMVYVTHDQTEALALADRIALMRNSRLEEIGTAEELYSRPQSAFTAAFLGGADLLPAVVDTPVSQAGSIVTVTTGNRQLRALASSGVSNGEHVSIAIRPHAWRICADQLATNNFPALIESVQWRGAGHRMLAALTGSGQRVHVDLPVFAAVPSPGDLVTLSIDPQHAIVVPRERDRQQRGLPA